MNIISDITVFLKDISKELSNEQKTIFMEKEKDISLSSDKFLNTKIIDFLTKNSNYPILSEEIKDQQCFTSYSDNYWIIDPLDGTLNYSREIPISCISIALWKKQEPIFGIIYDFVRDEMFVGNCQGDNIGAWLNGKSIECSNKLEKGSSVLCTGFPSWRDYGESSLLEFINKVKDWKKIRLLGSAAISLAWVAAGRVDAYIEEDIRIWDVAAGLAIIKAAGGSVYVKKNKRDNFVTAVATNGKIDIGELL